MLWTELCPPQNSSIEALTHNVTICGERAFKEVVKVKWYHKSKILGTSLVAQWLRIHLPIQGTRVQALVREDPTCRRATKPVSHNY